QQTTRNVLNSSRAEFKLRIDKDGTAVTAVALDTTDVDAHVHAINMLVGNLKQVTDEVEEDIGRHILAIKIAAPDDWETIVKASCGLSRSRSFELMAIADGVKTAEQTRRQTNARQARFRQNHATVRYVTDERASATTDTQIIELKAVHRRELADARAERDKAEEASQRQIARFQNEIAELADARNLGSERDQLRKALGEIVELLAEMRGLMTHSVQNRTIITTKIVRAEKIAASALKPAKVAV